MPGGGSMNAEPVDAEPASCSVLVASLCAEALTVTSGLVVLLGAGARGAEPTDVAEAANADAPLDAGTLGEGAPA